MKHVTVVPTNWRPVEDDEDDAQRRMTKDVKDNPDLYAALADSDDE